MMATPVVIGLAGCAAESSGSVGSALTSPDSTPQPTQPLTQPLDQSLPQPTSQEVVVTAAANPSQTTSASGANRSINVHGIGRASETPDQATVTMGVETTGATAQLALRENNAKATELIALLKSNGVEDRYIQTSQLSVYPQFDNQGRKIVGYQVSNIVTATVKDVKKAGAVIDAAAGVAGDAIRIQGLSFGLSDSSEPLKRARTRAVEDARAQAEQFAAAAGVKVGALRTISSTSVTTAPVLYQQNVSAKVASADSSIPLEAGSAEVTAEVDLVFDLLS